MKRLFLALLILCSAVFSADLSWAQPTPPAVSNGGILPGPTEVIQEANEKYTGQNYVVGRFLPAVSSTFTVVLFALAVGMIIIAGLFFIFSSGEAETKDRAKTIITWTLLGLLFAMISFALVKLVIGVNLLGPA